MAPNNATLLRVVRGSIMEGAMYQANDETPCPDPLTTIFQWIEHDDDVLEDEPQGQTEQYPAPLG